MTEKKGPAVKFGNEGEEPSQVAGVPVPETGIVDEPIDDDKPEPETGGDEEEEDEEESAIFKLPSPHDLKKYESDDNISISPASSKGSNPDADDEEEYNEDDAASKAIAAAPRSRSSSEDSDLDAIDPFQFIMASKAENDLMGQSDLDQVDMDSPSPEELEDENEEEDDEEEEDDGLIHIAKLHINSAEMARDLAEEIIIVLEEDIAAYLETTGTILEKWIEPPPEIDFSETAPVRIKISGDSISIGSNPSATLPGQPSQLRLQYFKGKSPFRAISIPNIQGEGVDVGCEARLHRIRRWHKTGGVAEAREVGVQTKEMTFVSEDKAQIIFMQMYPKPDDWQPPVQAPRTQSMEAVMEAAEKGDPSVDRKRQGPQIIKFANRKKLLHPLTEDYFKDETFWTGSRFRGEYRNRQFKLGHYDHPTGVKYQSEWKDGHFHSMKHLGLVTYPRGDTFEGEWVDGRYVSGQITFGDGLKYQNENWKYCEPPDRRLKIERYYGMKPSGNTIYGDQYPAVKLAPGLYDVGEGIYNPKTNAIRGYDGFFLRTADTHEQEWIKQYCRKADSMGEEYIPTFHMDRVPGSYPEQVQRFTLAKRMYH